MEDFVIKDGRRLRRGFTTGTCAAASARVGAEILTGIRDLSDKYVDVVTNNGINLSLVLERTGLDHDTATCTVIKDAGDDPDITDGMEVGVQMTLRDDEEIVIQGGEGIGIIRRKGLFGEVGDHAINPGPRRMIIDNIRAVTDRGFNVTVFAPRGSLIAKDTYNRNMGIEDGISILGSTGIVEPMSEDAIMQTIFMEIDAVRMETDEILLCPGNYGLDMAERMGIKLMSVKMSNFVGESVQYAVNKGFRRIVLLGHIGKFAKLSLGAFQTHNRTCDLRMEAFVYYLAMSSAPHDLIERVDRCTTSEEASDLILKDGYSSVFRDMQKGIVHRLRRYIKKDDFDFEVHFYSMEKGVLI